MNVVMHPIEPEELMAYLDGEVSSNRASVVAAHLSECAECRGMVSDLGGVSVAVKSWAVRLGEKELGIPDTVLLALEGESRGHHAIPFATRTWRISRGRLKSFGWIGAFAVIVLAVFFGSPSFLKRDSRLRESRPEESIQGYVQPSGLVSPPPPPPPPASPNETRQFDRLDQFARLQKAPPTKFATEPQDKSIVARESLASSPMIVRTADLTLITKDFDNARSAVEATLKRHRGYVGELKVGGATGSGRTLTATLRVPADQLDASLADLKTLGRVASESQSGQDVTSQYVDLEARLANARNTEQRLTALLQQRTGKLSDVLEVEQEVDRVRGEIEQMEAERKNMSNQVSFATLNATITEDYKAQLQVVPPSTLTRLSNAAVDGYKSMVDGMVGLALFLLENVPSLLLWLAILFLPARLVWKRVRRSFAQ